MSLSHPKSRNTAQPVPFQAFSRPRLLARLLRMARRERTRGNERHRGPGLMLPGELDPEMGFRADRERFELEKRARKRARATKRSASKSEGESRRSQTAAPAGATAVQDQSWDRAGLLEQLRGRIRTRHLSSKTEKTYLSWTRRYLAHHGNRHPASLGKRDVGAFLEQLATQLGLGPESQNQAASAIAFMYRELFGVDYGGREGISRPRNSKVLPRYASPDAVDVILRRLRGRYRVAAMIMYGSGLRVSEAVNLRIQDLQLHSGELFVRSGKGRKDRTTVVPRSAVQAIREQIGEVEAQHITDLEGGGGWAPLPGALHRKDPRAGWELSWQYLFPASRPTIDPKTGRSGRRPFHVTALQRAVKKAVRETGAPAFISCHVLRHCFATEMLRAGCDLRLLQHMMGHKDLKTTSRYLHIINRPGLNVISPLDHLPSMRPLAEAETLAEAESVDHSSPIST